jgi:hypothetical protein
MWLAKMIADGGILAINGIGLIHGEIPYRDWWDFKPPGSFILNGLGAFLFGQNPLGIRIFELLWIFISIFVFDKIVKRVFKVPSFSLPTFIFALLACSWALVRYGNTVTLWGILPWLLAVYFWLTVASIEKIALRSRYIAAFYFGMSLAGSFVIRQSAVIPAVVLVVALFFSGHIQKQLGLRKTLFCLALSILGMGVIIGALVLWLNNLGVLSEAVRWWKVTVIYIKAGWLPAFREREGMVVLRNTSMAVIPLSLLFSAAFFYHPSAGRYTFYGSLTRRLLLILLGAKFAIIISTGRAYNHYFMELIPELTLLAGPLFLSLENSFYQRKIYIINFTQKLGLIGAGILLSFQFMGDIIYFRRALAYDAKTQKELTGYILNFTSQERKYFSWRGYDPIMFALVDHRQISPLKFNWFLYDISGADPKLTRNLRQIMADRLKTERPPIVLITDGEQGLVEMRQYAPEVLSVIQRFYFPDKHFGGYWVWRLQDEERRR